MISWKNSAFSVFAATALMLTANESWAAGVNLVQNGDFEASSGVGQLADGVATTNNWTIGETVVNDITLPGSKPFDFIVNGSADSTGFPSIFSPPNIFVWGPGNGINNGFTGSSNGGYFFGSDGGYATAPISQDISGLTIGAQYTLSFEWAASQFTDYTGATTQGWNVTFGSDTASTTINIPSQGFSGWMNYSATFTASAATQTLTFLATGTPEGLPPFTLLDGVSLTEVTPAVPEPASVLMFGVGLFGALGLRHRSRKLNAK